MGWDVVGEDWDVGGGCAIPRLLNRTRGPPRARTTFADRAVDLYHPCFSHHHQSTALTAGSA